MNDVHVEKALSDIRFHPRKRHDVFLSLSSVDAANVLSRLSGTVLESLLDDVKDKDVLSVFDHMDPDRITDVLRHVSVRRRTRLIKKMSAQMQDVVETLMGFDPNTAAGLMSVDYILVDVTDTVASVVQQMRVHERRTGRVPAVLVMSGRGFLGEIPMSRLVLGSARQKVKSLVKQVVVVTFDAKKSDVFKLFRMHPHDKIVVLGETGGVLGVIYSDDVLRLVEAQKASSLYDFAGVHSEESVTDYASVKFAFRYKWLMLNLATAFLAAFTVSLFHDVIAAFVVLAIYMPIVVGMGGNAGTQTLAVMVRGMTLHQVEGATVWMILRRELASAFAIGLLNGALVALVVFVFHRSAIIAVILGFAMAFNLLVGAFFGTMVPVIMRRLGKDPATSANIFISTATDVCGFIAFLGLASLILL